MSERFAGFRAPHYTQVPDELFDELMPTLTGAQLKVLLYIIRHTLGWKKDADAISLTQITEGIKRADGSIVDRGAVKGRSTATQALQELERRGIICAVRQRQADGQHATTTYELRWRDEREAVVLKSNHRSPNFDHWVVLESDPQQTTIQQTEDDPAPPSIDALLAARPPDVDPLDWRDLVARDPARARRLVSRR